MIRVRDAGPVSTRRRRALVELVEAGKAEEKGLPSQAVANLPL